MFRATVDLRVPDKYVEINRILKAPIVEDFIHKFHDCIIWRKLDLAQGTTIWYYSRDRGRLQLSAHHGVISDLRGL